MPAHASPPRSLPRARPARPTRAGLRALPRRVAPAGLLPAALLAAVVLAGCAAGRGRAAADDARFGDGNVQKWACADGVTVEVQPLPPALPELRGHTGQVGQTGAAGPSVGGAVIRLRAGGPGGPVAVLVPAPPSASAADVDRWRSSDGGTEWFGRRGGAMTLRDANASRLTARDCRLQPR